jgi:hypothetical protein
VGAAATTPATGVSKPTLKPAPKLLTSLNAAALHLAASAPARARAHAHASAHTHTNAHANVHVRGLQARAAAALRRRSWVSASLADQRVSANLLLVVAVVAALCGYAIVWLSARGAAEGTRLHMYN